MLSKPRAPSGIAAPPTSLAAAASSTRIAVGSLVQRVAELCPVLGAGDCLGGRPRSEGHPVACSRGHVGSLRVIRTTVDGHRRSAGAAPLKAAPTIRTTVSESRRSAVAGAVLDAGAGAAAEVVPLVVQPLVTAAACLQPLRSEAEGRAKAKRGDDEPDAKAKKDCSLLEEFGPALLQAPLQLLSPWSGLGGLAGVAVAAGPGATPPMRRVAFTMPNMQEEEQFAALIFPGFDSDAFVWQITCLQVADFALSMVLGHNKASPLPCVLYKLGASWGPAIARGQLWRLVTPVMLHANLTHLLFNVFFQLRMGFGMERQFGRQKMMLIYYACGIFGNLTSVIIDPYKLAVGASTAGFGLIGVWLAEILLSWEILGPARERTVIWIVFMLISVTTMSSMTPNMDLWGHIGGAVGGFLLSIVLADMREQDRPAWYPQARVAAGLALALCLTGGVSKVLLFSPRDPIPDCPALLGSFSQAFAR